EAAFSRSRAQRRASVLARGARARVPLRRTWLFAPRATTCGAGPPRCRRAGASTRLLRARARADRARRLCLLAPDHSTISSNPIDTTNPSPGARAVTSTDLLRQHAEQQHADELAELAKADDRAKPPGWRLSPWAVRIYLLGGKLPNGFSVSAK